MQSGMQDSDKKPLFRFFPAEQADNLEYLEEGEDPNEPQEWLLPKYMTDAGYLYSEICSSSYHGHFKEDEDSNIPFMICVPFQSGLFDRDVVKKTVPLIEDDVYIRQYLDDEKYHVIFFVRKCDPKDWIGFAAFSFTESVESGEYFLKVDFEVVYVKPEYRGDKIGETIGRETARMINDRYTFDGDFIGSHNIQKAMVNLNAQCVNGAGLAAFSVFTDNFQFMFGFRDADCNEVPIPVVWDIDQDA